jgi:hypothetical protein
VGVLLIRDNEINGPSTELTKERAKVLGVEVEVFEARGPVDFERAFARWTNERVGAVVVGDHAFLVANSDVIAALTVKHRLPSVGPLELVIVFGNPKLGTKPMEGAPMLAIDVPLRALVSQDDQDKVWLTYNSGKYLLSDVYPRHGLAMPQESTQSIDQVLAVKPL